MYTAGTMSSGKPLTFDPVHPFKTQVPSRPRAPRYETLYVVTHSSHCLSLLPGGSLHEAQVDFNHAHFSTFR